jgi:alkanesulfonate monooxygenase SsuD/methylene tetrahydromethanopterin reductase-like flavin-dependent oxidoreductase (luciferase family)
MKFWYFSEAPYPYLPDADTYRSIRVTLPNSLLDPQRAADLWDRYLAEWQVADACGLNLMVNEHHATATCMNSAAPVVAGVLARTTTQGRILILGNPVANRRDPVRVAEEMAIVDILSRGRLDVGFVRSAPPEISAVNSKPVQMNERMWEAIDLICAAWTRHDGPFNWEGRFFQHRQVNIWPRPMQQPTPPIWITAMSPGSAARIADNSFVIATFLAGYEGTANLFDSYRERLAATGRDPQDGKTAYAALVYTGKTDAEGEAGARQLLWYLHSNKLPPEYLYPPGYMPYAARASVLRGAAQLRGGRPSHDFRSETLQSLINDGIVFAGSARTVRSQIEKFHENVGGLDHLILMGQAGFLDHDDTVRGIENFAEGVAPHFKEP